MNLPISFMSRMQSMLGEEYNQFINAMNNDNYVGLRINPLRHGDADIVSLFNCLPIPWCNTGYYYNPDTTPGKHPLHLAGAYYIQEPSAMVPVEYMNITPNDVVCDLCASPGGKSTQIAGKLNGTGLLISNEIHPTRAKVLSQNIERMGISNALVTNETPDRLANALGAICDKVLVDAPCSGEGMFRKNASTIDEWSEQNTQMCHARQLEILDSADKLLKAGGTLVYSTCTFAPIEDEGTISVFVSKHPEYTIEQINHPFDNGNCKWINSNDQTLNRTIRLFPHHIKGEGHFVAVLTKQEGTSTKIHTPKASAPNKLISAWQQWQKQNLTTKLAGNYFNFGDSLYLLPPVAVDISGLKVLRYGLHLGTLNKNIFEPSHSLALHLKPSDFIRIANIDYNQAINYLRGNTLTANCDNGWCVVSYIGYTLGLGKSTNGIIKNHYPKGLRI